MKIKEPIFFIGMARSGTSIIFEAFVHNPEIGYLSNYTNKFFKVPQLGLIHRFFSKHGQKPQDQNISLLNRIYPRPSEAYQTWEYLCGKKFRFSFLKDIDPTDDGVDRVRRYVEKLLIWQQRKRFATKLTGPPRIRFLTKIFSDAIFIDIIRDPRAVVASLINVGFWKRKGLLKPHWKDSLTEKYVEIFEKYKKSPVALAALEWLSVYKQTTIEKKYAKHGYMRIKYEDFIQDPNKILSNIYTFVNLKLPKKAIDYMKKIKYKNMNYKYHEELTRKEVKIIENICHEQITKLDYS